MRSSRTPGRSTALHSPTTAIVDFGEVGHALARVLASRGTASAPAPGCAHPADRRGFVSSVRSHRARRLVSCAGLYSDRVARAGAHLGVLIIPFRGEYYILRPRGTLVRGLIYPVPDPEFRFLGVHFTKRIQGGYEAGPNAVLAFAREGYQSDLSDLAQMFGFRGFWAMGRRYWKMGFYEYYRSLSRAAFLRALQKLVPDLQDSDLEPGGSGVRAQAVTPKGSMVDDFLILEAPNAIHVLNAPSPAATASLAIGRHIAGLAAKSFWK